VWMGGGGEEGDYEIREGDARINMKRKSARYSSFRSLAQRGVREFGFSCRLSVEAKEGKRRH
jgi:hypothetical protein